MYMAFLECNKMTLKKHDVATKDTVCLSVPIKVVNVIMIFMRFLRENHRGFERNTDA